MADPLTTTNRDELAATLRRAAEDAWGAERAADLETEIRGLSAALQRVAAIPLDYRDHPIGTG